MGLNFVNIFKSLQMYKYKVFFSIALYNIAQVSTTYSSALFVLQLVHGCTCTIKFFLLSKIIFERPCIPCLLALVLVRRMQRKEKSCVFLFFDSFLHVEYSNNTCCNGVHVISKWVTYQFEDDNIY